MSYEQPTAKYTAYPPPNYAGYPPPIYAVNPPPTYGDTPVVVAPNSLSVHVTHQVNDYLAWSLVNLCCGWGLGGILPLIFSILCRNSKSSNDYSGAQTMSTLALVFNIFITIFGAIGWLIFIIMMVILIAAANSIH